MVEVGAVGVAQPQPGHGVGEPAQQHQLAALQDSGLFFTFRPGIIQEQPPAQSPEQEGRVVDDYREAQVKGVSRPELLPGGGQVNVQAGGEKGQEGGGQGQGNQRGQGQGPAGDGYGSALFPAWPQLIHGGAQSASLRTIAGE